MPPTLAPSSLPARVTINDVARAAGLSIATVSKVLNRRPGARIPPETQQRVNEIAASLGYRPSFLARALARQRTHLVGVLYVPPMALVPRGIYETLTDELDRALSARGYQLMFIRLGEDLNQWRNLLADQQLDGCLLMGSAPHAAVEMLAQSSMPAVLVNLQSPTPLPQVLVDDFDGAVQVTNHLLSQGHRRIVYLPDNPDDKHYSARDRLAGYRKAMTTAGLTPLEPFDGPTHDFPALLNRPEAPTAAITYQHRQAVQLLQDLWRHNLRVPDDLSVATFNNAYPVEHTIPPLTTVALPTLDMGRRAAELLLTRIETPTAPLPASLTLTESIVPRESTAPPRHAR